MLNNTSLKHIFLGSYFKIRNNMYHVNQDLKGVTNNPDMH